MQLMIVDCFSRNYESLDQLLGSAGFRPQHFKSVREALACETRNDFAAVLVDHGSKAEAAAGYVEPLRFGGITQPIMVLSERDEWREKVACLKVGADDFVLTSVHCEEVVARLHALIRRAPGFLSDRIKFDDVAIDFTLECAWKSGKHLSLTRNEFRLIRLFLLNSGQFLSKAQIRDALWGGDLAVTDNAIEVRITRLRQKLGKGSIRMARSVGYRLNALVAPSSKTRPSTCSPKV